MNFEVFKGMMAKSLQLSQPFSDVRTPTGYLLCLFDQGVLQPNGTPMDWAKSPSHTMLVSIPTQKYEKEKDLHPWHLLRELPGLEQRRATIAEVHAAFRRVISPTTKILAIPMIGQRDGAELETFLRSSLMANAYLKTFVAPRIQEEETFDPFNL